MKKKIQKIVFIFVWFITASMSAAPSFSVYGLMTEQAENPIGVETNEPYFSWKIHAQERNFKQSAYHICIADSPAKLENDDCNIWNSGKVFSDNSIFNQFKGKKLLSSTTYYWRVKVWNDKGEESAWSQMHTFTTGLLNESDWGTSRWIAMEADGAKIKGIHYQDKDALPTSKTGMYKMPQFRKEFQIKEGIQKAFVYISGVGHFDLFINGSKVGDHFLDAGWTLYDKEVFYVSFDVTELLNKQDNVGALAKTCV